MRRTYLLLFETSLRDRFTDRVPLQGMEKGVMSHVEKERLHIAANGVNGGETLGLEVYKQSLLLEGRCECCLRKGGTGWEEIHFPWVDLCLL
jgi:hypothetical protein